MTVAAPGGRQRRRAAGAAAVRQPLRMSRRRSRPLPRTLPMRWPSLTSPYRPARRPRMPCAPPARPAARPPTGSTPATALPARPRSDRPGRTARTAVRRRVGVGRNRRRATILKGSTTRPLTPPMGTTTPGHDCWRYRGCSASCHRGRGRVNGRRCCNERSGAGHGGCDGRCCRRRLRCSAIECI